MRILNGTAFLLCFAIAGYAQAGPINLDLGSASTFAVLAATTVTNTGPSVIQGNIGVAPGSAVTGDPYTQPLSGSVHAGDPAAAQAERDLTSAYNAAIAETGGISLTGQNLGGLTITAGVYVFTSSAQLTGHLILDAQGDPNAVFIFQIASALTTASNSTISFINGGLGSNTFFQVGSSATLGTGTSFAGNILAQDSISMANGSSIACGRALALTGSVTLDTNNISVGGPSCNTAAAISVPEPSSATLLMIGILALLYGVRARSRAAS